MPKRMFDFDQLIATEHNFQCGMMDHPETSRLVQLIDAGKVEARLGDFDPLIVGVTV